jgi:hypothetical protein
MKIIALIDAPAVIRRIPTRLGLWSERKVTELGTTPAETLVDDSGPGRT